MDELRFRRLKALRASLDSPFFDLAIAELEQEMAVEIADCLNDSDKANAMRAERFALKRLRGRLESYTNDLLVVERKTEHETNG